MNNGKERVKRVVISSVSVKYNCQGWGHGAGQCSGNKLATHQYGANVKVKRFRGFSP